MNAIATICQDRLWPSTDEHSHCLTRSACSRTVCFIVFSGIGLAPGGPGLDQTK